MTIEKMPSSENDKTERVLEEFGRQYRKYMEEGHPYTEDDFVRLDDLESGEKIPWDVQGSDLLAKICQDFRLSPEEGMALREKIFINPNLPDWYKEE